VRNGYLLKTSELREIASKVIEEGSAVAHANGIVLKPSPKRLLARVLDSASKNKSSMLQDIEARRKTEIRQLNGSISRLGRLSGVSTPFNDLLAELVLSLERSQGNL
jgi:2-dehydropantoate 2-reductase